jgi:hypothetical protein
MYYKIFGLVFILMSRQIRDQGVSPLCCWFYYLGLRIVRRIFCLALTSVDRGLLMVNKVQLLLALLGRNALPLPDSIMLLEWKTGKYLSYEMPQSNPKRKAKSKCHDSLRMPFMSVSSGFAWYTGVVTFSSTIANMEIFHAVGYARFLSYTIRNA